MRTQLVVRARLLGWAVPGLLSAVVSLGLVVLTVVGTALVIVSVGLPLVLGTVYLIRPLATLHRRVIPYLDGGPPIPPPYLRGTGGGLLARLRVLARDPARRRDVYWTVVNATVGFVLSLVGLFESILGMLFWWLPPSLALRANAAIGRALLSTSEKSRMALRIEQLAESRADAVDTQAAELRRIERDLHDGAQARIVSLGMSLALAERALDEDPAQARALLSEARRTSSDALAELRDLVRGIHPPVLADRGLVGALQALTLACPVPVELVADVPHRLPEPVESAAYFAAAEALTNIIKHANATHALLAIRHDGDRLVIRVRDDGRGGADPAGGTGLRGVQRRLAAFDGTLQLSSPPGGPTELTIVIACVSSSPKTLPSSGTD